MRTMEIVKWVTPTEHYYYYPKYRSSVNGCVATGSFFVEEVPVIDKREHVEVSGYGNFILPYDGMKWVLAKENDYPLRMRVTQATHVFEDRNFNLYPVEEIYVAGEYIPREARNRREVLVVRVHLSDPREKIDIDMMPTVYTKWVYENEKEYCG
jgi:hypothetical protein